MEKIALLPIKEPIVSEQPLPSAFGARMVSSKVIVRLLEKIKRSKRIKALVVFDEQNCSGNYDLPTRRTVWRVLFLLTSWLV